MKKILFLVLITTFFTRVFSEEISDVITIELQKECYLTPIYIENTHSSSTELSQSYLNELEKILRFNYDHNGRTRVISQKEIGDGSYQQNRISQEWRLFGVEYVLKLALSGQYFTISVLSTIEDQICFAEEIKLSDDLDQDRLKIHKCSQNIH